MNLTRIQIIKGSGWALTFVVAAIGAVPVLIGLFTGFRPTVTLGAISIATAPTELPDDRLAIYMPVHLNNSSDNAGCILDIGLRVQDRSGASGQRWFFPTFIASVADIAALIRNDGKTSGAISGVFGPIYLPVGSGLEQELVFMHKPYTDESSEIMRTSDLAPGVYDIYVYLSYSDVSCMGEDDHLLILDELSVNISVANVRSIQNGTIVSPVGGSIDEKRKTLMDTFR